MPHPPIVALEIGSTKVVALVGEEREDGSLMITGMGEGPSTGVRKGELIDFDNAVVCARSALVAAETTGRVTVRRVHLAVSGGHIQSAIHRGTVSVSSRTGRITNTDIEEVMEVARALNLPPERDVLHTICRHFAVDEQDQVVQPLGMEGERLALEMLILHGVRSRLHNTINVVRSIPMDVEDVAFSGLCSALAVLTPEQKKLGALVIDLGGGTTDYLAYGNAVVAVAGALGVGGDHVTNDIALVFTVPRLQAERVKREHGSAVVDDAGPEERITLPPEVGFSGREIALRALNTVIHARMDETLRMVRERVEPSGVLNQLGAGVILTGGGARLRGVCALGEQIFGLPCALGRPRRISGLAAAAEGAEYATAGGLVEYGFRTASQRPGVGLGGWMKKLLGG
jgi:cell division protein FtsA